MKRIKYYTIHCTEEERNRGVDHYERFDTEEEAKKRADEINYSETEFISVEKHHEKYENDEWLPDWEMGDKWNERIDY